MLSGRVALVTGGARGIGYAIAATLAKQNATVVIADIDEAEAVSAAAALSRDGDRVVAMACDVTSTESVATVFARARADLGVVDILVNNALRTEHDSFDAMTIDEWRAEFDVTLHGAAICIKAALPGMLDRHRGVILNIASVNGESFFSLDGYSAAKAGLISLTRSIAVRYGPAGIRCNAIAPAAVATAQWDWRLAKDQSALEKEKFWYPLGRIGRPSDVANAALFLVSDAAEWISGVTLRVDGGLMAGRPVTDAPPDGLSDTMETE